MTNHITHFKNRKGILVAFGIFLILSGIGLFFIILMILMGLILGNRYGQNLSMKYMLLPMFICLVSGCAFVILGIGSIKTKKWAKTLILVVHWLWLIVGVFCLIFMLLFFPQMMIQMSGEMQSPEIKQLVLIMIILIGGLFFILHPLVFIMAYQNKNVKATVEYYHSHETWVDRCPQPVLALCIMQLLMGITLLFTGVYNWAIPLFGTIFFGFSGALIVLVVSMLNLYLVREIYLLNIKAWWILLAMALLSSVSFILTFYHHDYMLLFTQMNLSQEHMVLLRGMEEFWSCDMPVFMLSISTTYIVYLLYLKKYFLFKKSG